MKINFAQLEALMKKKSKEYTNQTKNLLKITKQLDKRLFSYIISNVLPNLTYDSSGRIKSTSANIDAARNIKQLKDYLAGKNDKALQAFYIGSGKKNANASKRYFDVFSPKKAIQKSVKAKGQKSLAVLVSSIFSKSNVQSDIESTISNAVLSGATSDAVTDSLRDIVIGRSGNGGINQRYHYQQGQDAMRAHGSLMDDSFAKALRLNYAVYTGSTKETTRDFCASRIGNVYSRSEIMEMESLEWSGKKKGHSIILDRGGWNCGHQWAWVSYELAKSIRKDIPKD